MGCGFLSCDLEFYFVQLSEVEKRSVQLESLVGDEEQPVVSYYIQVAEAASTHYTSPHIQSSVTGGLNSKEKSLSVSHMTLIQDHMISILFTFSRQC